MTSEELRRKFNKEFNFNWPATYEVDAETYGNVCQTILDHCLNIQFPDTRYDHFFLKVAVGPNNGLIFKGVELILKGHQNVEGNNR